MEAIRAILEHLGEADAVVPYFGSRDCRGLLRMLISRMFGALVRLLSGTRLRYYNGPVLHRTANVRRWASDASGFGYQAELLCRLVRDGISVVEVQIVNHDRDRGISKAFTWNNFWSMGRTCLRVFRQRLAPPSPARPPEASRLDFRDVETFRFY